MNLEAFYPMLLDHLQKQFDPNYTQMQAELYNMKNQNKKSLLYGTSIIGSDTRGQTIPELMHGSPRWEGLAHRGAMEDIGRRQTWNPRDMEALMQELKRQNAAQKLRLIMLGGGI